MKQVIGLILVFVFIAIAFLHIYWGLGGKWGLKGSIPDDPDRISKVLKPRPLAFVIVILGLKLMAGLSGIKSGLIKISIPAIIDQYGLTMIATIFLLRVIGEFKYIGLFKKIKSTEFARKDTKYYIPLCLMIAIFAILLQLY